MDFINIVSQLTPYVLAGLALSGILLFGGFVAYRFYQKKGGTRRIAKLPLAALLLLLSWLVVVAGVTIFSRGANYGAWFNFRLFSGYVNAWNQWSLSEFQLIVLNMLMFAPLGFLLPLLNRRLRGFVPVLLISVAVTVGIEAVQMVTRRGIFELDDILHNTTGSIAGYLIMRAALACAERRRPAWKPLLAALAIPLAFALLFSGAAVAYYAQELGNVPILPAVPQDMSKGSLQLTVDLPTSAQPVSMYRNDSINNLRKAEDILSLLKARFSLAQVGGRRIDGSNRVYTLEDTSGAVYFFSYSLTDGAWTFLQDGYAEITADEATLAAARPAIERWLVESGFMPPDSAFGIDNNVLRWFAEAPADMTRRESGFMNGIVLVQPSGGDIPRDLFVTMAQNEYVRKVEIRSPAEAFEEVRKGGFKVYSDLREGFQLSVDSYELAYFYDTKGYYRPAYRFEGILDGVYWSGMVSAMP